MTYEIVKIERRPKPGIENELNLIPWFTVCECKGRDGRMVRFVDFASKLPGKFKEIAEVLLKRGIRKGQRAVVRIIPETPYEISGYYQFIAE